MSNLLDLLKQAIAEGQNFTDLVNQQNVEVADTSEAQQEGLRNRPPGTTMVFPDSKGAFTTRGMKFPINIDKYNNSGDLVQSYRNVPPGIDNLPMGPKTGTVIETPVENETIAKTGGPVKHQSEGQISADIYNDPNIIVDPEYLKKKNFKELEGVNTGNVTLKDIDRYKLLHETGEDPGEILNQIDLSSLSEEEIEARHREMTSDINIRSSGATTPISLLDIVWPGKATYTYGKHLIGKHGPKLLNKIPAWRAHQTRKTMKFLDDREALRKANMSPAELRYHKYAVPFPDTPFKNPVSPMRHSFWSKQQGIPDFHDIYKIDPININSPITTNVIGDLVKPSTNPFMNTRVRSFNTTTDVSKINLADAVPIGYNRVPTILDNVHDVPTMFDTNPALWEKYLKYKEIKGNQFLRKLGGPVKFQKVGYDAILDAQVRNELNIDRSGNPIEPGDSWSWSDLGHGILDVLGLFPGAGEPFDAINALWYGAEGDYENAALSTAATAPFFGWFGTGAKFGKRAKNVKKIDTNPNITHYGKYSDEAYNDALTGLKNQGKYLDDIKFDVSTLSGKNVKFVGNKHGRNIVEVTLPNGHKQLFYKSSDLSGKGVKDMWQPYGGHMSRPGKTDDWFIKDEGFKDFYGSKSFRDIAGNLDRIGVEEGWDISKQVYKTELDAMKAGEYKPQSQKKEGGPVQYQEEGDLSQEEQEKFNWMIDYLESPMYLERLAKEFPNYSLSELTEEKNIRLKNLKETPISKLDESLMHEDHLGTYYPKEGKGGIIYYGESFYDTLSMPREEISTNPKKGTIELLKGYETENPQADIHERSHAIDDGGYRIPAKTEKLIHDTTDAPTGIPRYESPEGLKFGYYNTPSEFIARMQGIRYLLDKLDIYDVNTEFTSEHYDKMMQNEEILNDPHFIDLFGRPKWAGIYVDEIKEFVKKGSLKIRDKDRTYDPNIKKENFIELMNSIALDTPSLEEGTAQVKTGGPIKYQSKGNAGDVLDLDSLHVTYRKKGWNRWWEGMGARGWGVFGERRSRLGDDNYITKVWEKFRESPYFNSWQNSPETQEKYKGDWRKFELDAIKWNKDQKEVLKAPIKKLPKEEEPAPYDYSQNVFSDTFYSGNESRDTDSETAIILDKYTYNTPQEYVDHMRKVGRPINIHAIGNKATKEELGLIEKDGQWWAGDEGYNPNFGKEGYMPTPQKWTGDPNENPSKRKTGGPVQYQTEGNQGAPQVSLKKPPITATDKEKRNYYLNLYSNRNFVQRVIDPDLNIGKEIMDFTTGLKKTHFMTQVDNFVIPMVVEDVYNLLGKGPGQFHEFKTVEEAIQYAQKTGEFIQTDSEEEALWLSKNYKTDKFRRVMGHKKGGFVVSNRTNIKKALGGYVSSQNIRNFQNGGDLDKPDINVPDNFYEFLIENENAGVVKGEENKRANYYKKPGDKEPKFYPYDSVEGGQQTIGWGRKLNQKDDYKDGVLINKYADGLTYDQAMKELYISVEDKHNILQTRWGNTDWLNELSKENYAILLNHEFQVRRKDNVTDIDWNTRKPIEGTSTSRKGAARYPSLIQAMIEGNYENLVKEYIVGSSAGELGKRNDDLFTYFIEPQQNKYHFRTNKDLNKSQFYLYKEGYTTEDGKINKEHKHNTGFFNFIENYDDPKIIDALTHKWKQDLIKFNVADIKSKYKSGYYQSDGFIGPKQESDSIYSNFDSKTESILLANEISNQIDIDEEIENSRSQGDYDTADKLENVKNLLNKNRLRSLTEHIPNIKKWKRLYGDDDKVDINVIVALQELESIYPGITKNVSVSSAYRNEVWNKEVGGQPHSRHLYGMGLDLVGEGWKNLSNILNNSQDSSIIAWRNKWTSDKHGNAGAGVIDEGNHLHLNFIDVLNTGATWENYNSGNLLGSSNYNIPNLNSEIPSLYGENEEDDDFNVLDQYRNNMLSDIMTSASYTNKRSSLFQNRETDSFTDFIKRPKDSDPRDIFGPAQTTVTLQPWDDWRHLRSLMDTDKT